MDTGRKVALAIILITVIVIIVAAVVITTKNTEEESGKPTTIECGHGQASSDGKCICEDKWTKDNDGKCTRKRCINGMYNDQTGKCMCDLFYTGDFCETLKTNSNTGTGGVGGTGGNANADAIERKTKLYTDAYETNPLEFTLVAAWNIVMKRCLVDNCDDATNARSLAFDYQDYKNGDITPDEMVLIAENAVMESDFIKSKIRNNGPISFFDAFFTSTLEDEYYNIPLSDLLSLQMDVSVSDDLDWTPPESGHTNVEGGDSPHWDGFMDEASRQKWEPLMYREDGEPNGSWLVRIIFGILGGNPGFNSFAAQDFEYGGYRRAYDHDNKKFIFDDDILDRKDQLDAEMMDMVKSYVDMKFCYHPLNDLSGRIGVADLYDCATGEFVGAPF